MIYDFVVTVRNDRNKRVDFISVLICVASAAAFLIIFARAPRSFILPVSALLIAGGLVYAVIRRRKELPFSFSRLLLVAGITWLAMPFTPWVGLPVLILALIEKPAKKPLEIGFTKDRIVFNHLVRRRVSWASLNNVMLRDGLLTVDYKDNRLFQKQTIDEEGDADEEEFNAWCRERLQEVNLK